MGQDTGAGCEKALHNGQSGDNLHIQDSGADGRGHIEQERRHDDAPANAQPTGKKPPVKPSTASVSARYNVILSFGASGCA